MIELIFVIVILGILAAFALPKFTGMQNQAEVATIKGFTGTLNRTVGPMMWSTSISLEKNGTIASDSDGSHYEGKPLLDYMDNFPKLLDYSSVNFHNCWQPGGGPASPFVTKTSEGELNVFCKDGTEFESPRFVTSPNSNYTF